MEHGAVGGGWNVVILFGLLRFELGSGELGGGWRERIRGGGCGLGWFEFAELVGDVLELAGFVGGFGRKCVGAWFGRGFGLYDVG